jgi:hypothetical protein
MVILRCCKVSQGIIIEELTEKNGGHADCFYFTRDRLILMETIIHSSYYISKTGLCNINNLTFKSRASYM